MDKIRNILVELQNGDQVDHPYYTIRNIIQNELMHVATVPTQVKTYGERGHEYNHMVRIYGIQEKMKLTPKGGDQVISFYNEDWTSNLNMTGWDRTPGVWFQTQIKHLDNLIDASSGGGFVNLVDK